jgi:hypothetical protein
LLLLGRPLLVQVDDDKLHFSLVLLVETHGAASLPLGIESTLAEHKNVIRLALQGSVSDMVAVMGSKALQLGNTNTGVSYSQLETAFYLWGQVRAV